MNPIAIVTDGLTLFADPSFARRHNIAVVPARVRFEERVYTIGSEIGAEDLLQRLRYGATPHIIPPTVEDFLEIYRRLNRETTQILSIHTSSILSETCQNAQTASQMLLGRCDIAVIDSQTISVGVGMLIEQATRLIATSNNLEQLVRDIRRIIPRLYAVFYVETMQTISQMGLISEPQTILGSMLGIMPFLTIEEGQLLVMEKVRSHTQAVDKLVEFASEFNTIDQLVILTYTPTLTEPVRMLQDRLSTELSAVNFLTRVYGALTASLLGPDATGVIILEGENEEDF